MELSFRRKPESSAFNWTPAFAGVTELKLYWGRINRQQQHRGGRPPWRTLYGNNQAVYGLLRYGEPEKNHFALAEEVTLHGMYANSHERRPDIVLYLNGFAIGALERKNSRVSLGEGIRQSLSNQQPAH